MNSRTFPFIPASYGAFSNSILDRALPEGSAPSDISTAEDALIGAFRDQGTDWRSWAAMVVGGLAYRLGRVGTTALGAGRLASAPLQVLSVGAGLTAEVSAFELTHRTLQSPHPGDSNLWRWSGADGIQQGLLSSFLTFGTLKGAGHLARGESLILRHLLQDSAMILGTQTAGALSIAPRPRGSWAEQFLHAEAVNLQLSAAMSLGHRLSGGAIFSLERGLDLSLGVSRPVVNSPRSSGLLALEAASGPAPVRRTDASPSREHLVFSMGSGEDGKGGRDGSEKNGSAVVISLEQWRTSHTSPAARSARQRLIQQMVDASSVENVREQILTAMADWLNESPAQLADRQLRTFERALSRETPYFTKKLLLYVRTDLLLAKTLIARLGLVPIDSPLYRDREVIDALTVKAAEELPPEELQQIGESTYSRFQVEMDSYYPERSSQIPSRKEWSERVGALPPIILRAWNSPLLIPDQFLHLAYRLGVSQIAIF